MESHSHDKPDDLKLKRIRIIKKALNKFREQVNKEYNELTIDEMLEHITTQEDSLSLVANKLRLDLINMEKALYDFNQKEGSPCEKVECLDSILTILGEMQHFLYDTSLGAYQSGAKNYIREFINKLIASPSFQHFHSTVQSGESSLQPVDYTIYRLMEMTSNFDYRLVQIRDEIKYAGTAAHEKDAKEEVIAEINKIRKRKFNKDNKSDAEEKMKIIEVADILLGTYANLQDQSSDESDLKKKLIHLLGTPDMLEIANATIGNIKKVIIRKEEFWEGHHDPMEVREILKILNEKTQDHIKLKKIVDIAIAAKDKSKSFSRPIDDITLYLYTSLASGRLKQIAKAVDDITEIRRNEEKKTN